MQTCKAFLMFVFLCVFLNGAFSQSTIPTINSPEIPQIAFPTIEAPSIQAASATATTQVNSHPNTRTVTNSTSNQSENVQSSQASISTELTATALETISSLFSGDSGALGTSSLGGLEGLSSLGDLETLINGELSTTEDATTQALLQEILVRLTQIETQIAGLSEADVSEKEN